MSKYQVANIHNLALAGHAASGKTSLADALLFHAKAVDRQGSVDNGTSVSDWEEEEHKRKYSIDASVLHFDHKGKHCNVIDTPGYPDFVGAALCALNAVENAIIVIAADKGLEVNTRRMFHEAGKRNLGRMLVINKLDAENVDFPKLIETIQATFGKKCALFNAPIGIGPDLSGVVSVLYPPEQTPAGCPLDMETMRSQLVDAVVEVDEEMMEKYLVEGSLSAEELLTDLPKALDEGTVIPIFCTSAKTGVGLPELLDALTLYSLTPDEAHPHKGKEGEGENAREVEVRPDPDGPLVAQVFKSVSDKFVGTMNFLRIFSGTYKADQQLYNMRTHKSSRTSALSLMQGNKNTQLDEAGPGEIVSVTKVDDLLIGDTVSLPGGTIVLPNPVFPTPMIGLAVEPKSRGDEQKISGSLAKMNHEDPTFLVSRDSQTNELVITGMSQLHLDIIQSRLKRRFDLEVVTHDPKIPYRETILTESSADHRHKKQSGGRGQFGEVHMRMYPLPREITSEQELLEQFATKDRFEKMRSAHYDPVHNFAFIDTIVGGSIPNQFIPAVEKGCKEILETGALAGYRIQNVAVEVHFGKYHDVDSSEAAFKTAGRMAFKKAFQAATPVLLEPVVNLEVTFPSEFTGTVLGDLNTKRGRIENQDTLPGDLTVIFGKAPLAEVARYKAQLDSITHAQGSYTMEFSHYEQVPGNVQQQIVSKAKLADEEE